MQVVGWSELHVYREMVAGHHPATNPAVVPVVVVDEASFSLSTVEQDSRKSFDTASINRVAIAVVRRYSPP